MVRFWRSIRKLCLFLKMPGIIPFKIENSKTMLEYNFPI